MSYDEYDDEYDDEFEEDCDYHKDSKDFFDIEDRLKETFSETDSHSIESFVINLEKITKNMDSDELSELSRIICDYIDQK